VLANLVAVPLTALWVMPLGLASMALMPLGAEALTTTPMGWGIGLILWIGRFVSALPAATLAVPHMPLAGLLTLSFGLAVLCLLRTRLRLIGAAMILMGLLSPLMATVPDLLVSSDARLIALRRGSTLMIEKRSGASKFEIEAVERYWATDGEPTEFPANGRAGPLECDASACRFTKRGVVVLLPRRESQVDCAGAAAVVAPFPLRDACAGLPQVDRFSVWRDGAASVRIVAGGVRIETDRDWRGTRPWVPPSPARAKRPRPVLPPAATE
jgi:competence protein ComEC